MKTIIALIFTFVFSQLYSQTNDSINYITYKQYLNDLTIQYSEINKKLNELEIMKYKLEGSIELLQIIIREEEIKIKR